MIIAGPKLLISLLYKTKLAYDQGTKDVYMTARSANISTYPHHHHLLAPKIPIVASVSGVYDGVIIFLRDIKLLARHQSSSIHILASA